MADQSRADSEGGGYSEERMDGAGSKGERKDGKFEGQKKGRVEDRGSEIVKDGGGGGAGHGEGGGGGKGRGYERRISDGAHDGQRRSGGPEGQQKGGLRKWFRGNLFGGRGGGGYNLQRQYSQEPPKDFCYYKKLSLEEKHKLYKHGADYVTIDNIKTWTVTRKELKKPTHPSPFSPSPKFDEKVSLWRGDITRLEIDAVINATDTDFGGGGGIDEAIHIAAGNSLYDECLGLNGCPTGQTKITSGHHLPAKYILHTVGPDDCCKEKLEGCYRTCFDLILKHKLQSVAFCCIATGTYGYPKEAAAEVALSITREWLEENADKVKKIIFCVYNEKDHKIYCQKLNHYFPPGDQSDESRFIAAYKEILASGEYLHMLFGKMTFVGLPGLGKTTVHRRLTGEIVDIMSAGERIQPSTGVAESSQIIIRELSTSTISITQGNWSSTINLSEEACMFLKFCHEASTMQKTTAACTVPTSATSAESSAPKSYKESTIDRVHQRAAFEIAAAPSESINLMDKSYISEINDMLTKAMRSDKDWNQVKYSLKHTALIKMEDTGGQPEFMDMLPALVFGPSLYLIFCNLLHKLRSHYTVSYRSPSGEHTPEVQSNCTIEEVILQALSAVACFNSAPVKSGNGESSSSVAYIIGTHKDCVSEEQISEFDRELQHIIRGTTFYRDGLVEFASENRLLLAVDNKSGGAEEVESIRKFIENCIYRHFKKIPIPVAWLVLSLFLRKSEARLVSLQTCEDVGQDLGMSSQETSAALWFLHHRAGVLMYFPDIAELKDTIICDTQVIYDSVNSMIIGTFRFGDVKKFAQELFRETGQFSLEDIKKALKGKGFDDTNSCYLSLEQLVKLLEHHSIIAHIESSATSPAASISQPPKSTYLMPCILPNATSAELEEFQKSVSLNPHNPVPLMVRFECGFVPIGVFPATIANLVNYSSLEPIFEGIRKNCVHFHYGSDYDTVTLTFQPRCYTISIDRELEEEATTPIHEVCDEVRRIVETSLNTVTSHMNYTFSMKYQFSFECPLHPGGDHLCVVKSCQKATPQVMLCLDSMKKPRPVKMKDDQLVWFGKAKNIVCGKHDSRGHHIPLSDYVSSLPPSACSHLEELLDWDHEGVDKDLSEIADHMLDWEEKLATHLGLTAIDISDIRHKHRDSLPLQRREALQMWKNKSGLHATYGHLLELFVAAGHKDCVMATCKILGKMQL